MARVRADGVAALCGLRMSAGVAQQSDDFFSLAEAREGEWCVAVLITRVDVGSGVEQQLCDGAVEGVVQRGAPLRIAGADVCACGQKFSHEAR